MAAVGCPEEEFSECLEAAASVLSANPVAMKHTHAAGRVIRRLIVQKAGEGGKEGKDDDGKGEGGALMTASGLDILDTITSAATSSPAGAGGNGDISDIVAELEQVSRAWRDKEEVRWGLTERGREVVDRE